MSCPVCGTENPQDALFCMECGHRLAPGAGADAAGAPPAQDGAASPDAAPEDAAAAMPTVAIPRSGDDEPTTVMPAAPTAAPMPSVFPPLADSPSPGAGSPSLAAEVSSVSDGVADASPQAAPMRPATKRALIAGGIVLALLVALGVVYAVLSSTVFGPAHAASVYLQSIAAGQWTRASELSDPQLDASRSVLLTDRAAHGRATIANTRVTRTTNASGAVYADVAYTLDGRDHAATLTLTPAGRTMGIFRRWTVATPLIRQLHVTMPSAVGKITVNGVDVTARNAVDHGDGTLTLRAYPGSYEIRAARSEYYTSPSVTVVVADDDAKTEVTASPTAALRRAVDRQARARLDACTESDDASPRNCPFEYAVYGDDSDYRNFAWTIVDYPTVDSLDMSGSFALDGGEAKVTYDYRSWSDEWSPQSESVDFSASGSFTIEGDRVSVAIGGTR